MKKLTKFSIYSLITILSITTLTIEPSVAGENNSRDQSCNSNNGHGNNADIVLTLSSLSSEKSITVTRFDPSNPGNGGYIDR